ncbi:MAG: tRNA (adenosine(37)-N6)-dimethylallyltransferase MiaA [Bacteroidota bacterium]
MITVLGPTATGKTILAAHLASRLNGEIISADSRQVYKKMNIGTGKDYEDYIVGKKKIPVHLIDIVEPGYKYNVFQFQKDFLKAYNKINKWDKLPVLCGGTGLYIEAVLKGYKLIEVPHNEKLRKDLKNKTQDELVNILSSLRSLHNTTDILDRDRLVKAIEIATYHKEHPEIEHDFPKIQTQIFGIHYERGVIRKRITERLEKRLAHGMIEEVEGLLGKNRVTVNPVHGTANPVHNTVKKRATIPNRDTPHIVTPETLKNYGLEYRFITQHVLGEINYNKMFQKLNTAIHQFAKRQMTWFRKMERNGFIITWINGELPLNNKIENIMSHIN